MSNSIVIASAMNANLRKGPLMNDWVISGKPVTGNTQVAKSRDRNSYTMVWDCTAGVFNWYYGQDETLVVLTGEAFITNGSGGPEQRIAEGDVVFFPAGSSAVWRVPNYIRKVAFLRQTLPFPIGFAARAWGLLLRRLGKRSGGL